ncbi:hypothetical protein R1sor_006269 [Riccia sorocarpa]|uniref:DEK-C domain-containing protein n=1 Tax=Riccia sorocarpa TaxID=122646 RepID=A0ABD3HME2_9MARC
MDRESEELLAASVRRILEHADLNLMTESKVRKLAAEDTGLDLKIPANRRVVKRIIEDFFTEKAEQDEANEAGDQKEENGEEEQQQHDLDDSKSNGKQKRRVVIDEDSEGSEEKPSNKKRNMESDRKGKQRVAESEEEEEQEEEEDEEEEEEEEETSEEAPRKTSGKTKFERNENGDIVVCQLGPKRSVTVQNFQGKLLVSVREYYEKDGKQLPTPKGISLSVEQWEALEKGMPDVNAAIKRIQRA